MYGRSGKKRIFCRPGDTMRPACSPTLAERGGSEQLPPSFVRARDEQACAGRHGERQVGDQGLAALRRREREVIVNELL